MGIDRIRRCWWSLGLAAIGLCAALSDAEAQGRGDRGRSAAVVEVTFRVDADMERAIRSFYAGRPATGARSLPPGIRRNLTRGKPLPPGIAKRTAPLELLSAVSLPRGYRVVEVGLDVFIVEVATEIVHDILMDVIR